jgi:hypothetical protein
MVSDMSAKTAIFTPRDLNRQPAKVFAAVRKFGSVDIRTRAGETFVFTLKKKKLRNAKALPDFKAHWARLKKLGLIPPPASENERINRIIAGEE